MRHQHELLPCGARETSKQPFKCGITLFVMRSVKLESTVLYLQKRLILWLSTHPKSSQTPCTTKSRLRNTNEPFFLTLPGWTTGWTVALWATATTWDFATSTIALE